ncbi:hypothetical protein ACFQ0D_20550, partial [Micromonospora zhanjiangensis]
MSSTAVERGQPDAQPEQCRVAAPGQPGHPGRQHVEELGPGGQLGQDQHREQEHQQRRDPPYRGGRVVLGHQTHREQQQPDPEQAERQHVRAAQPAPPPPYAGTRRLPLPHRHRIHALSPAQ